MQFECNDTKSQSAGVFNKTHPSNNHYVTILSVQTHSYFRGKEKGGGMGRGKGGKGKVGTGRKKMN